MYKKKRMPLDPISCEGCIADNDTALCGKLNNEQMSCVVEDKTGRLRTYIFIKKEKKDN